MATNEFEGKKGKTFLLCNYFFIVIQNLKNSLKIFLSNILITNNPKIMEKIFQMLNLVLKIRIYDLIWKNAQILHCKLFIFA